MEKIEEIFSNIDPEVNTMIAFQSKINEIVDWINHEEGGRKAIAEKIEKW